MGTRCARLALVCLVGSAALLAAPGLAQAAEGFVETEREAVLTAPLTARVVDVAVQVGDRVEAGQALVGLDARQAEIEVRLAELELAAQGLVLDSLAQRLEAQKAALARLEAERGRVAALANTGRATTDDLAEVDGALAEAREDLELMTLDARREQIHLQQLQASRSAAALRQEATKIRAPFAGVVAAVHCGVGDTVRADESPVVTLVDPERVRIFVAVPAPDADAWAPGTQVRLTQRVSTGDRVLLGQVTRVAPVVDPERQTVGVQVALADPADARLRPGLRLPAEIVRPER